MADPDFIPAGGDPDFIPAGGTAVAEPDFIPAATATASVGVRAGQPVPEMSLTNRAGQFSVAGGKGFVSGAMQLGAGAIRAAETGTGIGPILGYPAANAADKIVGKATAAMDEALPTQDTLPNRIAGGIGAAAPLVTATVATGGGAALPAAMGAAQSLGNSAQDIDARRARGEQISGLQAATAMTGKAIVEAGTEAIGGSVFKRLLPTGTAAQLVGNTVQEAGTEAASQYGSNVIDRGVFGDTKPLSTGVGEAALIGGIMGGGMGAAGVVTQQAADPDFIPASNADPDFIPAQQPSSQQQSVQQQTVPVQQPTPQPVQSPAPVQQSIREETVRPQWQAAPVVDQPAPEATSEQQVDQTGVAKPLAGDRGGGASADLPGALRPAGVDAGRDLRDQGQQVEQPAGGGAAAGEVKPKYDLAMLSSDGVTAYVSKNGDPESTITVSARTPAELVKTLGDKYRLVESKKKGVFQSFEEFNAERSPGTVGQGATTGAVSPSSSSVGTQQGSLRAEPRSESPSPQKSQNIPPSEVGTQEQARKSSSPSPQSTDRKQAWQMTKAEFVGTPSKEELKFKRAADRLFAVAKAKGYVEGEGETPRLNRPEVRKALKGTGLTELDFKTGLNGYATLRDGTGIYSGQLLLSRSQSPRESGHATEVFNAVKSGQPVPAAVLADYPDLAQPPQVADTPAVASPKRAGRTKPQAQKPEATAAQDKNGNPLEDLKGTPVPVNEDGTVTVYHRTSPEAAAQIKKSRRFISKENTGEAFFSTAPEGYASGYGDAVVAVRVPANRVIINDAFENGEVHVTIEPADLKYAKPFEQSAEAAPSAPESKTAGASEGTAAAQPAAPSRAPLSEALMDKPVNNKASPAKAAGLEKQWKTARDKSVKLQEQIEKLAAQVKTQAEVQAAGKGLRGKQRDNAILQKLGEVLQTNKMHVELQKRLNESDTIRYRLKDDLDEAKAQINRDRESAEKDAEASTIAKVKEYPWWELDAFVNKSRDYQGRVQGKIASIADEVLREKLAAMPNVTEPREGEVLAKGKPSSVQYYGSASPRSSAAGPAKELAKMERDGIVPASIGQPRGEKELKSAGKVPPDRTTTISPAPLTRGADIDGIEKLKDFIRVVPEFKLDPNFTVTEKGELQFQDGGKYKFFPSGIGISVPESVKPGERIGIDVDAVMKQKGKFVLLVDDTGTGVGDKPAPRPTDRQGVVRFGGAVPPKEETTTPFADTQAEKRFQAAKGMDRPTILDRLKEGASNVAKQITRHFEHLDTKNKADAQVADILRLREAKLENAPGKAKRAMHDFVKDLDRKQYDRFQRMLVLPDIVKDIEAGKYDERFDGVPFFGRAGDTKQTVLDRVNGELSRLTNDADAKTKAAVDLRNREVRKLTEYMVKLKLLPKEVLADQRYYHRQVMEYLNAREYATTGGKGPDAKMRKRGFQQKRVGGGDFNTAYEQAEHEYLTHAFRQVATAEALNEIEAKFDISKKLKAEAKEKNLIAAFGGKANYSEFLALKAEKKAAFEAGKDELRDWNKVNGERLAALWVTRAEDTAIVEAIEKLYEESGSTSKQGDDNDNWYLDDEELADMVPAQLAQKVLSNPDDFGPDAVMAANWFFRAMADKRAKIKQLAGKQFVELDDLIPDTHKQWSPKANTQFARVLTVPESVLHQVAARGRVLTEADMVEMFARVPGKQYIIPENFADQLDQQRDIDSTALAALGTKINTSWKQYTLLNPLNAARYNLNNLSGDLDVSLAGDPRIVMGAKSATQDLIEFAAGRASDKVRAEIEQAMELGVVNSGEALNEIPDISKSGVFQKLTGGKTNPLNWYWDTVKGASTLRENVFRLAAYRRAMERVSAGDKFYWASKRKEIDAIDDKQKKAAKLARELLGDYGNISVAGQWIRRHAIPFWSWMEINVPRYVRLFRNAGYDSKASKGRVALAAGAKVGATAATAALGGRALIMYSAIALWNAFRFPGEDDGLEDGRLRLLLGKTSDGRTISIRFQGAFSDALSWFGAEDVLGKFGRLRRGEASVGDEVVRMAKAPVNKLINAAVPIQKGIGEAITGKSIFPDMFNPRQIRDRGEHLAGVLSLDDLYRSIKDIPQSNPVVGMIANTADPGEQAYMRARRWAIQYKEKLGKDSGGGEPSNKSNALYYFKKAKALGKKEQARRWLDKYVELGGNNKGYEQSMRMANPANFVSKEDAKAFWQSLSKEQQNDFRKGYQWYQKVYQPPR